VDKLDSSIIEILQSDGRASNAGIARRVGVSEGTVRRRLKRLIQDEFIQVVALPDPAKMGLHSEALVGIQVDPDKVESVADDLAGLKEVTWVAMTTGQYDIFAWVTLESAEALGIFLRTKVGSIPGVRRSETFVSLTARKRG
jgi:Lrp/AsnC family transcriptional regulator for asnA, asnC and gidA